MKDFNVVFESEQIYYVYLTEKLIDDYVKMINDPELQKCIGMDVKVVTKENEFTWIKDNLNKKAFIFSMIEKATNKYIGNIEIRNKGNNTGELGIAITKDQQNKHFGQEAIRTILDYAFNKMNMEKVELNVYNFNNRAIQCYKKVGFVENGLGDKPNLKKMVLFNKKEL